MCFRAGEINTDPHPPDRDRRNHDPGSRLRALDDPLPCARSTQKIPQNLAFLASARRAVGSFTLPSSPPHQLWARTVVHGASYLFALCATVIGSDGSERTGSRDLCTSALRV